ncbi:MAG: cytochrome-c oxidase, cbb3-type subunit II [Magnetococcales bacterium]|nr:cytochrome-c oxidase, cbb3-type subunit II [Magnetococcales bacterium]
MQHSTIEKSIPLMAVLTLIMVSIGGLVEIVPLFFIKSTIEKVEGMRPYTPLELKGRDIYIREGCYNCHSQMIRPFRDETERYGHYSLAAESMYDHPFQWGSKRTGPDLARIGGKYSNEWHRAHMLKPQNVVRESVMPAYPWLQENELKFDDIEKRMKVLSMVGVPYTPDQMANAKKDLAAQASPTADGAGLTTRYGKKVPKADFDGKPEKLTELDALLAYLQMLGTLVDFSGQQAKAR